MDHMASIARDVITELTKVNFDPRSRSMPAEESLHSTDNFMKKVPQKTIVALEEYNSNDDDYASGEGITMAFIAIGTSSPTSVSLFDAPNENLIPKFLMAKGIN